MNFVKKISTLRVVFFMPKTLLLPRWLEKVPKPEFKVLPVLTRETFFSLTGFKLIPQKKKRTKKESFWLMRAWKKCKGASSVPPLHFYQW